MTEGDSIAMAEPTEGRDPTSRVCYPQPKASAARTADAMAMTSVPEWDRQFRLVRVHHEDREELGRLRLAGIGADAVAVAGQLGEALSSDLVGRRMIVMIFRTDGNDR